MMRRGARILLVFFCIQALALSHASAETAQKSKPETAEAEGETHMPAVGKPIVKDYCSSFADVASERRLMWIREDLKKEREKIEARIEELKKHSETLKTLIETRKAMQEKVKDSLLKLYLEVEPEAAAQQLAKLEPGTAAEILVRMNPKRSGEILSLMDPKKAASLVALLTLQTGTEKENKS